MNNYRLVLSYDGSDFRGWQRQADGRTVQAVLEEAVRKVTGQRTTVHGAGRTDAGVHALAQVASFRARTRLDDATLARALNANLPPDVRVFGLGRAPDGFHARKSARAKVYQYRIVNAPEISPFLRKYALHWPGRLNVRAMREAAALFRRRADFSAFSSNRDRSPVRTVTRSEISKSGALVTYTVEAEGFLRYMVRTMVGTLLEVGRGRLEPEAIEEIFSKKDRSLAGPTAPARGLFLVEVLY